MAETILRIERTKCGKDQDIFTVKIMGNEKMLTAGITLGLLKSVPLQNAIADAIPLAKEQFEMYGNINGSNIDYIQSELLNGLGISLNDEEE